MPWFFLSDIKCGVHKVHVLLVQFFPQQLHSFAEPLEVDNFPFPQELNNIVHIRIVGKPQDIVVGHPSFLLRSQILHEVCHGIALDLHGGSSPGESGSGGGIDTGGVIHEVGGKGGILNLVILQIPCQLMNNCTDHFQMTQLLRADICQQTFQFTEGYSLLCFDFCIQRSQSSEDTIPSWGARTRHWRSSDLYR